MSKHDHSHGSMQDMSRQEAQSTAHQAGPQQASSAQTPDPSARTGMQQESLSNLPHQHASDTSMHGEETGGASRMMTDAVSATEQVGSGFVGGVAHVASDVVHGVGDVSNEVVSVVRDTATTAITGIGTIGAAAVSTLTGLLVGVVGGVREIGAAAAGRGSSMGEHRTTEQTPGQREVRRRETTGEEIYH